MHLTPPAGRMRSEATKNNSFAGFIEQSRQRRLAMLQLAAKGKGRAVRCFPWQLHAGTPLIM
jgi:hypothetical protein